MKEETDQIRCEQNDGRQQHSFYCKEQTQKVEQAGYYFCR
jgi:hypothetical protein